MLHRIKAILVESERQEGSGKADNSHQCLYRSMYTAETSKALELLSRSNDECRFFRELSCEEGRWRGFQFFHKLHSLSVYRLFSSLMSDGYSLQ